MKKKNLVICNSKSLLLIANYRSDVGYAWWLMESFWAILAETYHTQNRVLLAYPKINTLSKIIEESHLEVYEQCFKAKKIHSLIKNCCFIKRHSIRVIYLTDRSTFSLTYLIYRLCGVKLIIVHDHTPGVRTPAHGTKGLLKKIIHNIPLISADGVIGATDYIRERFVTVNRISPSRCYAAPNGLPPVKVSSVTKNLHTLFNIPADRKIMVMTGRAHRYKGVLFVLDCIAHLPNDVREKIHFLFVGDGPHLDFFINASQDLEIANKCSFVGKRIDVPSLLEGADFAIHASQGEVGYSLSILEYMRAGLPVVVPDNPSVCGATKHEMTGLIYRENDVQSASLQIERLITHDELRRKLGSSARTASQQFTLEGTHNALLRAFENIDKKGILSTA